MMTPAPVCWLFCTVIDNFGDIGVSWRLANMLHQELGWQVHLWLDHEAALRALCPHLSPIPCTEQHIHLHHWQAGSHAQDLDSTPAPQIVIETFACDLPPSVLSLIRQHRALWLNWEYLSAEDWAEAMHGKPSPQADGYPKHFWLMGFSERSGGLLREQHYPQQLTESHLASLRSSLALPTKNQTEWLLFGYASPIWATWLHTWQQYPQPITLLLAGKPIIESLRQAQCIPAHALQHAGDHYSIQHIRLIHLPFVPQNQFDALLHLVDGAIIRGEDSFVRAQLAGKPFLWHIYPQDEMAHLDKLHAFWQKAYSIFPPEIRSAHQTLSDELNGAHTLNTAQRLQAWHTLQQHFSTWQHSSQTWQQHLFHQASAMEKLAKFIEHR